MTKKIITPKLAKQKTSSSSSCLYTLTVSHRPLPPLRVQEADLGAEERPVGLATGRPFLPLEVQQLLRGEGRRGSRRGRRASAVAVAVAVEVAVAASVAASTSSPVHLVEEDLLVLGDFGQDLPRHLGHDVDPRQVGRARQVPPVDIGGFGRAEPAAVATNAAAVRR